MKSRSLLSGIALATLLMTTTAHAETVKIAHQIGVIFSPIMVMKELGLLEQAAADAGVEITPEWISFSSGSAVNDAVISSNVDIATVGLPNFLILWSRAGGSVKALSAISGVKSVLVTRDPDFKSLADVKPETRIAVPTLKVSNQAIWLQMAAQEQLGDYTALDANTVQLGFVDAMQALMTQSGAIDSFFAGPPYYTEALKDEGVHEVMSSLDITGPNTSLLSFTTTRYHDANPEVMAVFLDALEAAQTIINEDPMRAAEAYLASTGENYLVEDVAAQMQAEGSVFQLMPQAVGVTAAFMAETGLIPTTPESWRDFFFDDIASRPGADTAN
jgi:NitT/TauT family transport system substrate-binding protein